METKEFKLLLAALAHHEKRLETISQTLNDVKDDIAGLKVKAGLWGSLAAVCVMFIKSLSGN